MGPRQDDRVRIRNYSDPGDVAGGLFVGRTSGARFAAAGGSSVHSLPAYHGAFVAVWVGIPALVLVLLWVFLQQPLIDRLLLAALPEAMTADATTAQLSLYLSEIRNVAAGQIFTEPSPEIMVAAGELARWTAIANWAMLVVAMALMIVVLMVARSRLAPRFRARNGFERFVSGLMIFASLVAILTTVGIIASLLYESWRFFQMVPITEFLFGLNWEPQIALREPGRGPRFLRRRSGIHRHAPDRNDGDAGRGPYRPVHGHLPGRVCQ